MIRFSFNIGCSESKVIFKRRKKKNKRQIKMLYREQTFAPPAFHSELQQQTESTHMKARLEPAITDAQKLAQNVFPPWTFHPLLSPWPCLIGDGEATGEESGAESTEVLPVPSVYMQHLLHSVLKISALCLGEVEVEFFPVMAGSQQIELLKGFARYGPS